MSKVRRRLVLPLLVLLAIAACADQTTAPAAEDATPQANVSASSTNCDLTRDITRNAGRYFSNPEKRAAQDLTGQLSTACSSGNQTLARQHAVALLSMMETALAAGRGGSATDGSDLANGLLACTASLCSSAKYPNLNLSSALSDPAGMFAVRGNDNTPAIARAKVQFTDFGDNPNAALWGLEVSGTWSAAARDTPVVLLYGTPAQQRLTLLERGLGSLQYDFNRWPRSGTFKNDDMVHVGVCFDNIVVFPHAHNRHDEPALLPRIQREGTLLSAHVPSFCGPSAASPAMQSASVAGSVVALVKPLLPSTWFATAAVRGDVRTAHMGGSALDFSRFAAVAANTDGKLEWVTEPASVVSTTSLGTIRVRAVSGAGTPIERVKITLSVQNNSGSPAGAIVGGTPFAFTREADGIAIIDEAVITKTGGYIICATVERDDFTFTPVCSNLFHVRR